MRIWLYYAKAGGGHLGPAKSLAMEFEKKFKSKTKISWFDLGHEGGKFLRTVLEGGYSMAIHKFPWVYAVVYELNKIRFVIWLENLIVGWFLTNKILRSLQKNNPDLLVATFFLVGPIKKALKKLGKNIPLAVVVTEPFSAPPIWFFDKKAEYLVSSEEVIKIAKQEGVNTNRIHTVPQIVLEDENGKLPSGLDLSKKVVLLVGGGNGFPHAGEFLKALLKSDLDVLYVVVCGTNTFLKKQVERISKRSGKKVTVFGFVNFMSELISVSDVVITKAGANMVWEVLLQQKPLILAHYVWGQEKGTVKYVVENKLGLYEPNPNRLSEKVRELLYNEELKIKIKKAQQKAGLKNGAPEAVEILSKLVV